MQVFFQIQSSYTVLELVANQKEYIKENNIGVTTKLTKYEYTRRIGLILGVNI